MESIQPERRGSGPGSWIVFWLGVCANILGIITDLKSWPSLDPRWFYASGLVFLMCALFSTMKRVSGIADGLERGEFPGSPSSEVADGSAQVKAAAQLQPPAVANRLRSYQFALRRLSAAARAERDKYQGDRLHILLNKQQAELVRFVKDVPNLSPEALTTFEVHSHPFPNRSMPLPLAIGEADRTAHALQGLIEVYCRDHNLELPQ